MTPKQSTGRTLVMRLANSDEDLEFLRPVIVEFHKESHFSSVPISHEKIDNMFFDALANPDHAAVMMAAFNDEPVGFLYCVAGEYLSGCDATVTTIHTYYVRPKFRRSVLGARVAIRLLKAAVRWAEQRRSREIILHVTSGIDIQRTDRFVTKAGFRIFGANYSRPLQIDG